MCELVAIPRDAGHTTHLLNPGGTLRFTNDATLNGIETLDGYVFQCWHPESEEWSTMLPPVDGMAWKMTAGSKVRLVRAEDAPPPAPSMVEQVEAVAR